MVKGYKNAANEYKKRAPRADKTNNQDRFSGNFKTRIDGDEYGLGTRISVEIIEKHGSPGSPNLIKAFDGETGKLLRVESRSGGQLLRVIHYNPKYDKKILSDIEHYENGVLYTRYSYKIDGKIKKIEIFDKKGDVSRTIQKKEDIEACYRTDGLSVYDSTRRFVEQSNINNFQLTL